MLWLQSQGGVDAVSEHTGCGQAVVGCDFECEIHRAQVIWVGGRVDDGSDDGLEEQPTADSI